MELSMLVFIVSHYEDGKRAASKTSNQSLHQSINLPVDALDRVIVSYF